MSSSEDEREDPPRTQPNLPELFQEVFDETLQDIHTSGLDVVRRGWLNVPVDLMKPKKMCAVNQFVHIVDKLDNPYLSSSCELVLVGTGTAIPEHFRWMIYCMEMINNVSSLKNCFLPVLNTTRALRVPVGRQTAKSKPYDVIGIERVVSVGVNRDNSKRTNWPKTLTPQETFLAECSRLASDAENHVYARINPVQLHWGLIPVEYQEHGVTKRRVFHVLRAVPQPGVHLLELIRKKFFEKRGDNRLKDHGMVNEVCHLLQQIVNHEADINYGMIGVWNSSLPSPWSVTDPANPTSVQRLLSPFTVLKRILQHIPGGHCGMEEVNASGLDDSTLVIDGFPDVSTPESLEAALGQFSTRQELYLKALRSFEIDFHTNVQTCASNPEQEVLLKPILSKNSESFNLLNTKLNMTFTLQNYLKFSRDKLFADADRIVIPKLGIALMDLFIFFDINNSMRSMSPIDFIKAHVGEHLVSELVTETRIALKYRVTDVQSLEDFPKAGQHKSARDGYKRNAAKMIAGLEEGEASQVQQQVADFYQSFLRLQFTATMNGLLMDSWLSDRVFRCATIAEMLVGDLCPCKVTKEALGWVWEGMTVESRGLAQYVMHDEIAFSWVRINAALCKLNETVKANALNLAIIWGMIKSDVLTFLGLHNQTWRWIMYCMLIAPLFGHMRTLTEDGHTARSECILTAKPNSVGLNDVIVKTVNYCLEGLMSYVVPLTDEDRTVLRLDKVDRRTRAGMEASQGVELANGRVIGKPTSSNFMQAVAVDEALRSFDDPAIAALITTGLPRDSNAGEGSTHKMLKPERGHDEKGQMRQLPGMGWYVLCFATNSNAQNKSMGEQLKTLSCGAMVTYAPGAPQSNGLASALTMRENRKRGRTIRTSASMGESLMPADALHCKYLAFLLSINGIASRHIGLVNKTAQSNWEISLPVQQYIESVKLYFFENFPDFVSANYAQSCDRQFKGFIARSVSACLMSTVLSCTEQYANVSDANFQALLCMESSALTLYWANMALLNGITHLLDAGLCVVNQLIRWKLDVPVLSVDFLCSVLDPALPIDKHCNDFKQLERFLHRLRNARTREDDSSADAIKHFTGSYVQVQGLGSSVDYGHIENYLLKYCGLNLCSVFTYLKTFRDASHRSLDFSNVLDLPKTMMDVRILFERCDVRYEAAWYTPPGTFHDRGTNYLILVPDPADAKGTTSVGAVWAHVTQVLMLAALMGPVELHADNSIALGKGVFKLIAKRTLPQMAVPSTGLLCETFTYQYGQVVGDFVDVPCVRHYFYRPRVCFDAWRTGKVKSLNCYIGAHPLEDVVHIHAWVQLHFMHMGKVPSHFYFMPNMVPRSAELVPGRVYPLINDANEAGVICVCPMGQAYALLKMENQRGIAVHVERWQHLLQSMCLQVAPLIFRDSALVKMSDGMLGLVLDQRPEVPMNLDRWKDCFAHKIHPSVTDRNFLSYDGLYTVLSENTLVPMHWRDVHEGLLPLGTHLAIPREVVRDNLPKEQSHTLAKLPTGQYTHVVGWLRYPDECDEGYGQADRVFVAFRIMTSANECEDVCIVSLPLDACVLSEEVNADYCIDYLWPV